MRNLQTMRYHNYIELFLLIFVLNIANGIIKLPEDHANGNISNCVKHISQQIRNNFIIFVHKEENNVEIIIKDFSKNSIILVDINKNHSSKISTDKTDMYVFIISTVSEYDYILNLCNKTDYWNPRARFLVLFYGTESIDTLVEKSWEQYIINLLIVNERNENIYTYFPYASGNCGNTSVAELSIKCQEVTMSTLFPEKIPFNMNGCPVKYGATVFVPYVLNPNMTTDDPKIAGIETVIIKNFLETMNLRGVISDINQKGDWGFKEGNGTFTGAYKYLSSKTSQFIFGHMWANMAYLPDFDMSSPFYTSQVYWYVPTAQPTKPWKSIFIIFTPNLWTIIIVLFIFNSFFSWIFGCGMDDIQQLKDLGLCILQSLYSLCIGTFLLPTKIPLKILILNWTIFGLFISLIYQSQLLTLLTKPSFDHQISNLEELVESNVEIIITALDLDTMESYKSDIMNKMLHKATILDYDEYFRRLTVAVNQKTSFAQVTCIEKYHRSRYYTNEDGSSKLYKIKENPYLWFGTCIFTLKGFPFLNKFDDIMLWIRESGLLTMWEKNLETIVENVAQSNDRIVLNLNHFLSAFFILFIGLILSFIGYIGEIVTFKYKTKLSYTTKHCNLCKK